MPSGLARKAKFHVSISGPPTGDTETDQEGQLLLRDQHADSPLLLLAWLMDATMALTSTFRLCSFPMSEVLSGTLTERHKRV